MSRDPKIISKIMASVRSSNTAPEIALRKVLHSAGHRFRIHPSHLPGKPDLTFPSKRLAVFVDGDFWHGRQWKVRGFQSLEKQFEKSKNRSYWVKKLEGNIRRDTRVTKELRSLGWQVLRIWESDIKSDLRTCVGKIQRVIGKTS